MAAGDRGHLAGQIDAHGMQVEELQPPGRVPADAVGDERRGPRDPADRVPHHVLEFGAFLPARPVATGGLRDLLVVDRTARPDVEGEHPEVADPVVGTS